MPAEPFAMSFFDSAVNMDLKLYYCGSENCLPKHSWGPGVKNHYKIHYVHSGTGKVRVEERHFSISAGQGFLIVPGVKTLYQADADDPWSYSWVAFQGLHAGMIMKRARLSGTEPVIQFQPRQRKMIDEMFQNMFEAQQLDESRDMKLLGLLYSFLGMVVEAAAPGVREVRPENMRQQYVRSALEYMEQNYCHSISIENMSDELKLSRKYLSRLFKESVGIPPHEYLIRLRMNAACELLKIQTLEIKEISCSVGYSDQLLFSRMFKKYVGCAPSIFRKSLG